MTQLIPASIPKSYCILHALEGSGLRPTDISPFRLWLGEMAQQGRGEQGRAYGTLGLMVQWLRAFRGQRAYYRAHPQPEARYDKEIADDNARELMEEEDDLRKMWRREQIEWPSCSQWKAIVNSALARWNPRRFAPRQRMGQSPRIAQQAPRRQMVAATARRPQKLNELDSINLEIDAMESASGSPSLGVTPTEESRRGFKPSFIGVSNPARPRDLTYIKMRK